MLKKIDNHWQEVYGDTINNGDDIDGLIFITTDNRKFKIKEILKDGKD